MSTESAAGGAFGAVEYTDIAEVRGPLLVVRGVTGVGFDESALISMHSGEVRNGLVLEVDRDLAVHRDGERVLATAGTAFVGIWVAVIGGRVLFAYGAESTRFAASQDNTELYRKMYDALQALGNKGTSAAPPLVWRQIQKATGRGTVRVSLYDLNRWWPLALSLGLTALLLLGNRQFGVSSNLRHLCAGARACVLDVEGDVHGASAAEDVSPGTPACRTSRCVSRAARNG